MLYFYYAKFIWFLPFFSYNSLGTSSPGSAFSLSNKFLSFSSYTFCVLSSLILCQPWLVVTLFGIACLFGTSLPVFGFGIVGRLMNFFSGEINSKILWYTSIEKESILCSEFSNPRSTTKPKKEDNTGLEVGDQKILGLWNYKRMTAVGKPSIIRALQGHDVINGRHI